MADQLVQTMPRVEGAEDPTAAAVLKRLVSASKKRDNWRSLWQDCYDLAMPGRTGFHGTTEGKTNTLQIFDGTAVTGALEFASKIAATMMPPFMRWVDLKAGRAVPAQVRDQVDLQLAEVTKEVFEVINGSNFHMEAVDAILEMSMSTGVLVIEDGDATDPLRATAVPLTQVVLDRGPFGEIDFFARPRKIAVGSIRAEWPRATIPQELADKIKSQPDAEEEIVEATYRDWRQPVETYRFCVIWKSKKVCLVESVFSGLGSCPWIAFSWARDAAETYGRGPLLNCLSSIKTANLTVQLTLENAETAITGMYQYDDDGVVNPDNIEFVPGALIPRDPQSRGLESLEAGGNFNVSNLILNDERENIKRALYVGQFAPLDKTPMSATEVAIRQQDLAQRIGASWGRLQRELIQRVIQRVVFLLRRQGRIAIPRVDGREVMMKAVSPLAKSQNQEDIMAIDRFLEQLGARFGPNIVPIVTDPMRASRTLGNLHGVPPEILRSEAEAKQIGEQLQQLAQAGAQQGPGTLPSQPLQPR